MGGSVTALTRAPQSALSFNATHNPHHAPENPIWLLHMPTDTPEGCSHIWSPLFPAMTQDAPATNAVPTVPPEAAHSSPTNPQAQLTMHAYFGSSSTCSPKWSDGSTGSVSGPFLPPVLT